MIHAKYLLYLALAAATLLPGPVSAARNDVLSVMDVLAQTPSDQKLTAWIETAEGNVATHNVGDELRLNLQSNKDTYIYVLRIDANGVGWLTIPRFDQDNLLRANEPAIYPSFGEPGGLVARLPLGPMTTYIVATTRPIEVGAKGGSEIEIGTTPERFDEINRKLTAASAPRMLAAIKLEHEVKARKGETQFSAADIVSYFTTTTRAIQRPKIPADIKFEFGSAKLTPEAKKNLNEWGTALTNPNLNNRKFRVGGHTDDIGSDEYNMKLSWGRAVAVKDYLVKEFRIAPDRLITEAFGKSAPMAMGTSEEARAANRRVEFEMPRN